MRKIIYLLLVLSFSCKKDQNAPGYTTMEAAPAIPFAPPELRLSKMRITHSSSDAIVWLRVNYDSLGRILSTSQTDSILLASGWKINQSAIRSFSYTTFNEVSEIAVNGITETINIYDANKKLNQSRFISGAYSDTTHYTYRGQAITGTVNKFGTRYFSYYSSNLDSVIGFDNQGKLISKTLYEYNHKPDYVFYNSNKSYAVKEIYNERISQTSIDLLASPEVKSIWTFTREYKKGYPVKETTVYKGKEVQNTFFFFE